MSKISKIGGNIKEYTDCKCGCNNSVADTPIEMLEFLLFRFSHSGVSATVASYYARDIKRILDGLKRQNTAVVGKL